MSTSNKYKITALKRAPIEGTCVLTDDQLTSSTGSPITFPTSGGSLTTSTELAQLSSTVNDMQLGVRQAKVFDSENEMNVWLSTPANTATLAVGHAIFIRETGVPDYWWDGTRALPIEQEKVSLQGYVTEEGTQTLTNKTLTAPKISYILNGNYTLTIPLKTATLATKDDIPNVTNFITANSENTLKNKTLYEPIIAKIKPTSSYEITVPQKTGTMALTSDITTVDTSTFITTSAVGSATTDFMKAIINLIYPVGYVMFKYNNTSPASTYTWQTWTEISAGYYVKTTTTSNSIGTTGGSSTTDSHALSINELPAHTHKTNFTKSYVSIWEHAHDGAAWADGPTGGTTHTQTITTESTGSGNGHTHTFTPPYIYLKAWRRTA